MDYGKNLVWFLHEVSVSGLEQLEDGYVEIVTESDTGGDCSCDIEITDVTRAAADRISELERALHKAESVMYKAGLNTDWIVGVFNN
jgi:hypothetical protein